MTMAVRSAQRPKPEHMTHLRGNSLVRKDHPRILFRGWIDALEGELLLAGRTARRDSASFSFSFTRVVCKMPVLPFFPVFSYLFYYNINQETKKHRIFSKM